MRGISMRSSSVLVLVMVSRSDCLAGPVAVGSYRTDSGTVRLRICPLQLVLALATLFERSESKVVLVTSALAGGEVSSAVIRMRLDCCAPITGNRQETRLFPSLLQGPLGRTAVMRPVLRENPTSTSVASLRAGFLNNGLKRAFRSSQSLPPLLVHVSAFTYSNLAPRLLWREVSKPLLYARCSVGVPARPSKAYPSVHERASRPHPRPLLLPHTWRVVHQFPSSVRRTPLQPHGVSKPDLPNERKFAGRSIQQQAR
jgi:hypothetical protein